MSLNSFLGHSLKTRVTIFTLAIFLASIWALAIYSSRMLREDMVPLLGEQQFLTVSAKAEEIRQELNSNLALLGKISGTIEPVLLTRPAEMEAFFAERPVLLSQFSAGVLVVGMDGVALAESRGVGRVGHNYLDDAGVAAALKSGRSSVDSPEMNPTLGVPTVSMVVPIRGEDASVIGALLGVIDLSRMNSLGQPLESRYGNSGYYLLVDGKSQKIISNSGRTRLLESLLVSGASALFGRFAQGYDERGLTLDANGLEVLASARRINVSEWFLIAALPVDEAFAAIRGMQQRMLLATLFLTLVAGGLTWWMLRRELLPMLATIKTLASLSVETVENQTPQPLPVIRRDEIGDLIEGFNHLLSILAQRELALRESDKRFRTLHDASFDGLAIHDQGYILDCNQSLSDLSGYAADELVGMEGRLLIAPEWRDQVVNHIQCDYDHPLDCEGLRKDGGRYHLCIRGKSIPYKGEIVRVCEFRDITERKLMEEQVRQLAFHDPLTKLPNRRLLNDRLEHTIATSKRTGCYSALMFLDLDNFKPLNDTFGHGYGDLLLIEVADRIKHCVRETDTVARFGGDEFVVILSNLSSGRTTSTQQAELVAEKVRTSLARPYLLNLQREGQADSLVEHQCTASIGVVLFINRQASQDDILKWADSAMYHAKEDGRNMIRFYEPESA